MAEGNIKATQIELDFSDRSSILRAMENYSTIDFALSAVNLDGEQQLISFLVIRSLLEHSRTTDGQE